MALMGEKLRDGTSGVLSVAVTAGQPAAYSNGTLSLHLGPADENTFVGFFTTAGAIGDQSYATRGLVNIPWDTTTVAATDAVMGDGAGALVKATTGLRMYGNVMAWNSGFTEITVQVVSNWGETYIVSA